VCIDVRGIDDLFPVVWGIAPERAFCVGLNSQDVKSDHGMKDVSFSKAEQVCFHLLYDTRVVRVVFASERREAHAKIFERLVDPALPNREM